ncbi:hypothetical protein CRM22_003990 [Opisthorchis felineus]|uniref:Uncharacterized protein n=1 Tax=Opisthorchis felineus TaxID=147828 RepID=A0A4S2LYM1_OPIFE|nr:hypothetical protein CRM22_003990 [Opisthorchis felineus]
MQQFIGNEVPEEFDALLYQFIKSSICVQLYSVYQKQRIDFWGEGAKNGDAHEGCWFRITLWPWFKKPAQFLQESLISILEKFMKEHLLDASGISVVMTDPVNDR